MIKRKSFGLFMVRLLCFSMIAVLCGCAGDYDYSCDRGPIQIGCRSIIALPAAGQTIAGNPSRRVANFRFGFPWWLYHDGDKKNPGTTIHGAIVSPLLSLDKGELNGMAVSCIFVHDQINGLVIAPLFNMNREMNGVALSCWNWSADKAGLQLGVINFCEFLNAPGEVGAQVGMVNEAGTALFQFGVANNSWNCPWLQSGLFNTVIKPDKFTPDAQNTNPAVQIGLYNDAPRGFQIGLLNRNENSRLWKWCPFVNF